MTGIIVACLLTWSEWRLAPHQAWFQAESVAQCQKIARAKKYGMVSTWQVYDMNKERDRFDFAVRCGQNGKDCEKGQFND